MIDSNKLKNGIREYVDKYGEIYMPITRFNILLERSEKRGHWIMDETGAEYCSECGKYPFDDGIHHIAGWHSDYCPHCGAKMEERKDDE